MWDIRVISGANVTHRRTTRHTFSPHHGQPTLASWTSRRCQRSRQRRASRRSGSLGPVESLLVSGASAQRRPASLATRVWLGRQESQPSSTTRKNGGKTFAMQLSRSQTDTVGCHRRKLHGGRGPTRSGIFAAYALRTQRAINRQTAWFRAILTAQLTSRPSSQPFGPGPRSGRRAIGT